MITLLKRSFHYLFDPSPALLKFALAHLGLLPLPVAARNLSSVNVAPQYNKKLQCFLVYAILRGLNCYSPQNDHCYLGLRHYPPPKVHIKQNLFITSSFQCSSIYILTDFYKNYSLCPSSPHIRLSTFFF